MRDHSYNAHDLNFYKDDILEKTHLKFIHLEKIEAKESCALALQTIESLNLPQLNLE